MISFHSITASLEWAAAGIQRSGCNATKINDRTDRNFEVGGAAKGTNGVALNEWGHLLFMLSFCLGFDGNAVSPETAAISLYKGIPAPPLHGIGKKYVKEWARIDPGWNLGIRRRRVKSRTVQSVQGTLSGEADPFAPTQWSVIVAAGESQTDPDASRIALAKLCETYWPPLYTYLRKRGLSPHDAQDLTQSFFAYLIERKIYTRTDREKGKFRSFLLASLKNFLSDARDREQTLKRGGGHSFVPLHEAQTEAAESFLATCTSADQRAVGGDQLFERSWAETLVTTALKRLAAAYQADGNEKLFEELQTFLTIGAAPLPTYPELATRLGIAESTLRSHVTRLRARYRKFLRAEVRRTVNNDAEVDDELRELLRVLAAKQGIDANGRT
jgi:RNA polymerase sigma-70 factor (ECF subfamily)